MLSWGILLSFYNYLFHCSIFKTSTQLKSLAKTTEAVNAIKKAGNATEELRAIGRSYTTDTLKAAIAQSTLNKTQIKSIMSANGLRGSTLKLTTEELFNATSTNKVAASQATAASTTSGLGYAFKGLGIRIKEATLPLLKFLFTNPAGWATLAVTAIAGVAAATAAYKKKLEEQKQAIREAADEAKSAIDSIKSDFDTLVSDTNKVKKRYAELAQGVENLGKANQSRGTLSTEDYEEFLDLSNQLYKLFPQLAINFDNNGNAILNLSGNVDTIVGSLENLVSVQQKLAKQEILEKMPGVWSGYMLDIEDYKKSLSDAEEKSRAAFDAVSRIGSEKTLSLSPNNDHDEDHLLNQIIIEALTRLNYGKPSNAWNKMQNVRTITSGTGRDMVVTGRKIDWDFSSLDESQFEQFKNELGRLSKEYENAVMFEKVKIDSANSNMASYINTWLSTEWNYNKLNSNLQIVAKSLLFDGDWISLIPDTVDSTKWDEVSDWIQKEFLFQLQKAQDNEEISNALSEVFSNAELTPAAKASYIKQIQDYFGEESMVTILLQPQLEETTETAKAFENSIRKLADDHGIADRDEYIKLSEYTKDFTQEQVELWLEATQGAENAAEAIQMYEDRLAELEKELNPISFSDIFSLKDADNDLTKLGKISESIDTIQNAYKTLNDAIDEYNEEGAFSIDTLQSVIALGDDWLDFLVDEEGNLKLDKEALEELAQARLNDMRIQAINNVIDNVSKIQDEAGANEYLASTNYALADSYEAVAKARLSDARANMSKAVEAGDLSQSSMDAALNKATADIDKINKLFANTSIGAGSITGNFGKGKSSSKSEFSETVDFFERRVEVLDNALSHLKSTMDNISGSSAKNNLIDAELGITGEKFKNYTDALSLYTQKANEALSKLPADIAAKVKDGAVSITDFIGDGNKDVVEAIKDYETWADKISDCKQELAELQKEIRQIELEKFNNIMEDFQNQFDLRGDSKDLISKQIDLLKEAGELVGESFFTAQINQSKKQLELLEAEKAQLVNQMSSAINSGRIQKGTEEWMSMVSSLNSVDSSILECKKSIEEFDNSILDLHTEIFNRIQDQFSNLDSEISNILDLFEEFEVSDDIGIWSKEGIAQLGLLSQQYELAQYQIQQYNDEIDKLNAQYLAGKYSATEYADKLADLTDKQWDAVKASESAKDALMDLNKTRIENQISGIEKEINAYKELTDAQIEALKASKDLHDYEKSIAEKTKSITDLERQIAAMQNDNSAATIAKRKKLEEQLTETKKDLEETEYNHSIETQEDALNKQYETYEKECNDEIDALRESLNDKETILAESFNTVKNNASTVGQEIATIATQHGITVSKSLISSWQSGEKAIASYGAVLSQNTSAFIGNIMDVENEIWNLQTQANTTADSLAWMFSTKADNLVNELTTSYYAESNLAYMTQALQNSLINMLERGYNVNSIVNSLNSIENAANSAKTAIDRLNNYRSDFIENIAKSAKTLIGGLVHNDKLTYEEDLLKNENVASHTTLEKYASGTRSSKGEFFISDEDGYEMKLPKLASGQYTIANEGTQILTKAQTDNIFEWAKFNPEDFVPINMTDYMDNLRASTMPNILPNNVNNSSVNVHYDSLITVQGSLNSTDVTQMEAIANKAVDRMVDKINDGIAYGR